jgi:thiol-disulfide isomerase/thioredoxin
MGIVFVPFGNMKYTVLLSFLLVLIGRSDAQSLQILHPDSLVALVNSKPDSGTLVINFWATWCGPCVREIPYFVRADTMLKGENVRFVFVSFDDVTEQKKAARFIKKTGLPGTQYLISSYNPDSLFEKVDPKWGGVIPYTVVIDASGKRSHIGAFDNYRQLWFFIRNN